MKNKTAIENEIPKNFRLEAYDYELPKERIAQFPAERRGASRLLGMIPQKENNCHDTCHMELVNSVFERLPELLPANALLVANNVKVLPCRIPLQGAGGGTGEFMLLSPLPHLLHQAASVNAGSAMAECLLRPASRYRAGKVYALCSNLDMEIVEKLEFGRHIARLRWQGNLEKIFLEHGKMPLPPYIRRNSEDEDKLRYQTCYASREGAMAAPTAGLHFTPRLKDKLASLGFEWREITLYTGYGTFSPVRSADIREHEMHSEFMEISPETALALNRAKAQKRPVIAVGTTSLRALESMINTRNEIESGSKWTNIYIYPGYEFKSTDGLITNFHLPQSSLLILVSAFCGREAILRAYAEAIKLEYNFFSYGDAMFILRTKKGL